ncbi:putative ABC transporter permease [Eubacterium barkeri]|uniref:Putative ABC-transporter type IV n=1 Tax=Eubacterium barkeri TaxID=1528 RepID=A0A1H3C0Z4_EUBBA|nr:putative ABC transporter permease [Eubacterium barkeri]SDX47304.1 Putative ABC-transporter type IV [Eubacterium barkeri]
MTLEKTAKRQGVWYAIYECIWIFALGGFLGVVVETSYCFLVQGIFENRSGLIYGMFNPVYGFGAVLITLCLKPLLHKKWVWIFLLSMVIGSAFEFCCSFVQQGLTGTVSWVYTNQPFNILGRTSLGFAIAWGALGVLFIKEIYPLLHGFILKIPRRLGVILACFFVVFISLDMALSAVAVQCWNQREQGIPITTSIQIEMNKRYPDSVMKVDYPNITHVDTGKVSLTD